MSSVTIHAGHPYYQLRGPWIIPYRDGTWCVKWRSFDSIKQDADFSNEADAISFADAIRSRVETVFVDEFCELENGETYLEGMSAEEFRESDEFWRR